MNGPRLNATLSALLAGAGAVAASDLPAPSPVAVEPPARSRAPGSRRRKLWEIPHKFHCPVIGVCFSCTELRRLLHKVMHFPADAGDFTLHITAVAACETRSRLAELLQRTLEQRFAAELRRWQACKSEADLRQAWQSALAAGQAVPAALWAVWTHPACTPALEQVVYGDIHMLQHQVGSGTRVDLAQWQQLKTENRHLQQQLQAEQQARERQREQQAQVIAELRQQLGASQAEAAGRSAAAQAAQRELAELQAEIPDLLARRTLAQQLAYAREQVTQLQARLSAQTSELARLRDYAAFAETSLEALAAGETSVAAPTALASSELGGKCVLCVGGRAGLIHAYRDLVVQAGGRFLHHDGGLEDNLHRIDGALAAADIVICQAGCISHNAYWRVKEVCKRSGKPCMFLNRGGVASFGRLVADPPTGSKAETSVANQA